MAKLSVCETCQLLKWKKHNGASYALQSKVIIGMFLKPYGNGWFLQQETQMDPKIY